MGTKGILYNMGGWAQLFFLGFLCFAGLILASFVLVLFLNIEQMWESANNMRLAQAIQTVCLFLIPAIIFTYLCQDKPETYLKTDSIQSISICLLSIVLMIAVQPMINLIGNYNHQMVLPESMASIERWMRDSEAVAEKTLTLLFTHKSIGVLISNLLVIAVLAGLAEEFFFRGVLQQIIRRIVINEHVAVWATAIIFSAIHLQFYGFFPRILMGAVLGYLFIWANSIWIPVIAHTVYNAVNVILAYLYFDTPEYQMIENIGTANWGVTILSFVVPILILFMIYRKRIIISKN